MPKASRKNPLVTKTSDGGTMKFIAANSNGLAGRIEVTRGYKETPDERAERLRAGDRSRVFNSGNKRGGRRGEKAKAIKDSLRD